MLARRASAIHGISWWELTRESAGSRLASHGVLRGAGIPVGRLTGRILLRVGMSILAVVRDGVSDAQIMYIEGSVRGIDRLVVAVGIA